MAETIFSKIIRKEIPAEIVFENDTVLAFKDINPKAPVHILIIPKITELESARDINSKEYASLLADLFLAVNEVAKKVGVFESGYRLIINSGADSGQEVPHLHIHLLGGKKLTWNPG